MGYAWEIIASFLVTLAILLVIAAVYAAGRWIKDRWG